MKKTILICAAMALTASSFAQKSNLRKIENITYGVQNMNTLPAEKWVEIKELVNEARNNPETAEDHRTWDWIGRSALYDRQIMLQEYQANGNKFKDMKAFFSNEEAIVSAFEKYYKLIQTPNEKGKLPLKEKDLEVQKQWATANAGACRTNLFVGATQFVYDDPQMAVKLLEAYLKTFDSPLFEGQDLKNTDKNYKEAPYVYATALKGINGDKAKIEELLKQSLTSSNGPIACQDLITLCKEKGDKANETKYLLYAFDNYPQINIFGINLAQEAINDKKYDETIKICDEMIKRMKDGTTPTKDEAGNEQENIWYPYYFKAVSLFNSEKFEEAYNAFVEGDENCPGHIELVMGAGTAAAKFGNNNFSNKAVCKPWFEKAVKYLSKAEQNWPDQSDQWGYQLYACYHNLENKVMEANYKKYAK